MVSNWHRQAWEPATAERPQVNLTQRSLMPPHKCPPLPLLRTASPAQESSWISPLSLWEPSTTDHLSGSTQQKARFTGCHAGPQAWSPLLFAHECSHRASLPPHPVKPFQTLFKVSSLYYATLPSICCHFFPAFPPPVLHQNWAVFYPFLYTSYLLRWSTHKPALN